MCSVWGCTAVTTAPHSNVLWHHQKTKGDGYVADTRRFGYAVLVLLRAVIDFANRLPFISAVWAPDLIAIDVAAAPLAPSDAVPCLQVGDVLVA